MIARIRRLPWAQRLLLWAVSLLSWPRRSSGGAVTRIALLRFDRRLGEVLLQTPLVTAIQRAWPTAEIVAVVHPRLTHLLKGQPGIAQVIPFTFRGWPFSVSSWQSVRLLSRARVEVAIDCSNFTQLSTSHAVATVLSRAPRRVGFARGSGASLCYNLPVAPLGGVESERQQRLHLLSALGIEAGGEPPRFAPQSPVPAPLASLLAQVAEDPDRYAVVNPGGRLGWRRLSPESLAAVARRLIERGRQVLVVWGPGERPLAEALANAAGLGAVVAPSTDVDGLAHLLKAVGCTITNNSGPMHLSVAVGAPTLAVFLDMPVERWGYRAPPHAIVDVSGDDDPRGSLLRAVDRFLDDMEDPVRRAGIASPAATSG